MFMEVFLSCFNSYRYTVKAIWYFWDEVMLSCIIMSCIPRHWNCPYWSSLVYNVQLHVGWFAHYGTSLKLSLVVLRWFGQTVLLIESRFTNLLVPCFCLLVDVFGFSLGIGGYTRQDISQSASTCTTPNTILSQS